ncbi:unnamed protein product [Kuraishia capsulata CBS 1993]|uniref:FAD/NAD(P)-binding domain-containing protein n=1 Tax=Kuraishia capsulata CBS 1993 TaxID=1382522 RepID=W6MKR9_9ASCO|nr:uncharacterized protein KUCA_T00003056001 [Kuraishia capsulata CBS 1993]CDK27079.1 unnamed protein product [Kuraishia capsulata CBS 1993]
MTFSEEPIKVSHKVESIAVIGGGASAAITLQTLHEEKAFEKIKVFEKRAQLGGNWFLAPDKKKRVPIVSAGASSAELEPPSGIPEELVNGSVETIVLPRVPKERFDETGCYHNMKTNVVEKMMTFSDRREWPKLLEPVEAGFTDAPSVHEYLLDRFSKFPDSIQLGTTVETIRKKDGKFVLYLRQETDEVDSKGRPLDKWWVETFDAIVLASGEFRIPFIPSYPGIKEAQDAFPERFTHSKFYDGPQIFKDKVVLIVGSRISANDLVTYAVPEAAEVYNSRRSYQDSDKDYTKTHRKPAIEKFVLVGGGFDVHFVDGSVLKNPDLIAFATGYSLSFPYMNDLRPNFTTGVYIPSSFQQTFHTFDPLITSVGVHTSGMSFRIYEAQATTIARFYAGKISLPSEKEQEEWKSARLKIHGPTRKFHDLDFTEGPVLFSSLIEIGGGKENPTGVGRSYAPLDENDRKLLKESEIRIVNLLA